MEIWDAGGWNLKKPSPSLKKNLPKSPLDSSPASPAIPDAKLAAYAAGLKFSEPGFGGITTVLGHLLLYNLGWFLTCFGAAWFPIYSGMLGGGGKINFPVLYLLFLIISVLSVGWLISFSKCLSVTKCILFPIFGPL